MPENPNHHQKYPEKVGWENMRLILHSAKEAISKEADGPHDFDHHQAVYNNCLKIVVQENLADAIDLDALLTAAAWHDFRRHQNDYSLLIEVLHQENLSDEFVDRVLTIIKSHSFAESPESVEGRILWDADKIEYLSVVRDQKLRQGIAKGEISLERVEYYKNEWKNRIGLIWPNLHFNTSKRMFLDKMDAFNEYVSQSPELKDLRLNKEAFR